MGDSVTAGASTAGDRLQSVGARRVVRVRTVGLTQGAAFLVVGAVVAALVLRNAFVAAHRTVGWVVACSIVAMLVDPLVGALQRYIPRWLSIVVVVLGSAAAFVGVVVGLAHEVLESLDVLEQAAPRAARELEERYDWAADVDVSARVQSFVDDMHDSIRESTVGEAIGTVPTYLVTGILMLFLLGYGRRYFLGALKLFDDLERRRTVRQVATVAADRGRVYMLVTLAMALAYGVAFGLLCWAMDVPAPLSLGAAVAIMSVLPLIGVVIGGVPALLLAFGSLSWTERCDRARRPRRTSGVRGARRPPAASIADRFGSARRSRRSSGCCRSSCTGSAARSTASGWRCSRSPRSTRSAACRATTKNPTSLPMPRHDASP